MNTPVLHYLPISNNPAQKSVKKSSAGAQADFDSIVFYVPVDSLNGFNSTSVVNSVEIASVSAATPKVLSNGSPVRTNGSPVLTNGRKVYAAPTKSPETANSVNLASAIPVVSEVSPGTIASVLNIIPNVNSSPVAAGTPVTAHGVASSPKVNGTAVQPNTSPYIATKPQVKRLAEEAAVTLVFFDLETTGLAHEIGKYNVQITEISMVAMNRKEFQKSTSSELKDIRILQKICLCTRPRASVSPGAAKVTGLNNGNLIDQEQFNPNAAAVITTFLSHLPKPVCLLAHNGASYDYPLLKAEFNRLSIQLSSDILIADTLKAFRALGVPVFPPGRKIAKSVKYGRQGTISYALDNLHLYFFNKKPVGSHSSEGDCIALAKVCHSMKDLILPWVDENYSTMDSVVPMW